MAGIGTAAIQVGMDFEAGMSNVAAISGATGEDLEALTEKAKEMGSKTKFSATESAEAFEYMAMAGWKTDDMLNSIEGIMNLAAASGENLASTSDIVTDAMTAFGMSADGTTKILKDGLTKEVSNATHFADVLAAASSNANTNVGMMGETFKYVAPVAGALGFSVEDTAVAIGLMANSGIKAGQAGTSLRAIMSRLAKPTDEVQAAMDALGVSITNSDGSMKSLNEIMLDLRKGFDGLSESEKAQMAASLGGQEAMSGLLAIVNASDEDFEKLTSAINDCDGAAADMAATMQDNLAGQITILKSGLEGLGLSIYESIEEPMKNAAKEAINMVDQLQQAYKENGLQGMVDAVGTVMAQMVQKVADAAPQFIDTAVDLITGFCDSIKNAPGIGESGAKLITSLVTALLECTEQLWTTAITLVGKLAEGLASGAPQMVDSAIECISGIVNTAIEWAPTILDAGIQIAGALIEGIASSLPDIFDTGIELLNNLSQGIQNKLPDLIPLAMDALMNFSGTLRENVGELVDAGLNLIMTLAQALIDNIPVFIETVPTIITNLAGIINDNAPKLLESGIELIVKLAAGLIQAIPTLVENIPQIIEAIVSAFTAFNWLSLGKDIITFIKNGIESLATSIPTALKEIGQTAKDWFSLINWKTLGSDLIDLIKIGIESLLTAIPTTLKDIGTTAVTWFKEIDWLDLGTNLIKGIIAGITGALDGVWTAIGDLCSGILDAFKGFFGIHSPSTVMQEQADFLVQGVIQGLQNLPGLAAEIFGEMLDNVIQWGQDMLDNAKEAASNTLESVTGFFSELPGNVGEHLSTTLSNVISWGSDVLENAKTAASDTLTNVTGFFSELPGNLQEHFSSALDNAIEWGANTLENARTAASDTLTDVTSFFSQMPGNIEEHLSTALDNATTWGNQTLENSRQAASDTLTSVTDLFSQMPGNVQNHLTTTLNNVNTWGSDTLSNAKQAASDTLSNVVSFYSQMPGKIQSQLTSAQNNIKNFCSNMVSNMKTNASNALNGCMSYINQLPGKVKTQLNNVLSNVKSWGSNAVSNFKTIGKNVIQGLINGISSMVSKLYTSIKNALAGLVDKAKKALGINSPSKVFADEVGKWIPGGIEQGIDAGMPSVNADMTAQAGGLVDNAIAALGSMPEKFSEILSAIGEKMAVWGIDVQDTAGEASDGVMGSLSSTFAQMPDVVQEHLDATLEHIKNWSSQTKTDCISGIISLPEEMGVILEEAGNKAKELGSTMTTEFKRMGDDSIQSMIDGIQNKTSELYDCIRNVLSELVEEAKESLEINSPSAVFADQIGQWIPSGIEEGIRLEMPELLNSLKAQSDSLVETVIDGLAAMPERSTSLLRETLDKAIEWGSDIIAKGKELARDLENGFNGEMPRLSSDFKSQVDALIRKMHATVKAEAEKIEIKNNVTETYKIQQENGNSFKENKTEVTIDGTIHTHVDLDGEEIAEVTTPFTDRNLGRKYTQAARGV